MAPSGYGWTCYRGLLMELLLLTTTTRALPAPRLAGSPFPVSSLGPPSTITVLNLTGTSFDERVLAMSAVGVVAQARADLATVDADDSVSDHRQRSLSLPPQQHATGSHTTGWTRVRVV